MRGVDRSEPRHHPGGDRTGLPAPSVHNTQPWRWSMAAHSVPLFTDPRHGLAVIDPTGRKLVISCGAVLHRARIAFRALGWQPHVQILPTPACPDHLAAMTFQQWAEIDHPALTVAEAIGRRRCDRRPFPPDPIPRHVVDRVAGVTTDDAVRVTALTLPAGRQEVLTPVPNTPQTHRHNELGPEAQPFWPGDVAADHV